MHFRRLIGIVICTSFQRQQENVNLTLAANFGYLLRNFMEQLGMSTTTFQLTREPSNFACKKLLIMPGNQLWLITHSLPRGAHNCGH